MVKNGKVLHNCYVIILPTRLRTLLQNFEICISVSSYFTQGIRQVLLKVEQARSTWLVSFFKLT